MDMIKNVVGKFILFLCLVFIIWIIASYMEIVSKNLVKNPTYNNYNAFVVLMENTGSKLSK